MKKQLLSFFIVLCALTLVLPFSHARETEAAPEIQISDSQFQEDGCTFQVNLSGTEIRGAVFAVVYAQSGQMTQIESRDANETLRFSLRGLEAADSIKVIWLDARSTPLAQGEVADRAETFAGALRSMIQNYEPERIAQDGELSEYALARLLVKSTEALPNLEEYRVAERVSDGEGHTILQFRNEEDAERCAAYLSDKVGDGYVEPDRVLYLPDEDSDASSVASLSRSVSLIHADAYAADLLARGINNSVIVAVVDTGVDYNHEFLQNRTVPGYDCVSGDEDPVDEQYHGTHVAGTIVDCTPNLTNLKIMPVRVLDETGHGYASVVAEGIRYAANHGANVINLSLGGTHNAYKEEAITYALEHNVTVVVAAGNDGIDANYSCPAHVEGTITVAAVDFEFRPADFSNYGSVVDIAAPGVDINSSVPRRQSASGYCLSSGTSMSTPHVSACAAMLLDEFSALSPSEVERRLTQAAQVPQGWNQAAHSYGSGVADMASFVQRQAGFYAILYSDNGELVFQDSATPEPGRPTAAEPYFVSAASGDGAAHVSWHAHRADIQTVTFADTDTPLRPVTTAAWFAGCENLSTVRNLRNLDTSRVTDMSQMFAGCAALTSLDLSELDTSNVTDMRQMFFECSGLETLDLSEWDTGNVSSMADMFNGCQSLRTIYASKSFDASNVTDGEAMFQDCAALEGALGTAYSPEHADKSYARRDTLSASGYFSSSRFYAILYTDGEFSFQDTKTPNPDKTPVGEPYRIACVAETPSQRALWYDRRGEIQEVTFADEIQPITTATWFLDCENLQTVRNVANLNTLHVTDMSQMFAGCAALTGLNLSALNTNNVTNMRQMFFECSGLETLDLSDWNTGNVSSMADMFNGCESLRTIRALNKFLVTNVTDGESMFQDCALLVGGNGTRYDPAHVDKSYARRDAAPVTPGYFSPGVDIDPLPVSETLYAVLYSDGELAFQNSLDAQNGKTVLKTYETDSEGYAKGNARGSYMAWYDDRASITSVNFAAAIYPASTAQWFYSCENLAAVQNPANLHTDYVTDMGQMFAYCRSLTTLDLSGFHTAQTVDMSQMFYRCGQLTEIRASDSFSLESLTNSRLMFGECVSLTGGQGTPYSRDHTDGTYARIDDAPSAPGYFTA